MRITNTLEFIQNAKRVHGDKYDYDKSEYINSKTKVCIICPKHGEFWQKAYKHICGQGCVKCYNEKRHSILSLNTDVFIERSRKIHGEKYGYDNVEYKNGHTKVCIICPKHGKFWQAPNNHLRGCGCPKCAIDENHLSTKSNKNVFINKSRLIHGENYDYHDVVYINNKTKVCIKCPIHGEFWMKPNVHLSGCGCPKCGVYTSKAENEICNLISEIETETNNRTILDGKEIDIYVPSIMLGIEYNGCLWHTEENGKNNNYHLSKTQKCNQKGIDLIHIFEDEWILKRNICEYIIKEKCGLNKEKNIDIDECKICEINDGISIINFLNKNSLYEDVDFSICIGASYKDDLIGLMCLKNVEDEYTINVISNNINFKCSGLIKRLIEYFIFNYKFKELYFEADRRWWIKKDEKELIEIGFKFENFLSPKFFYYNNKVNKLKRYKSIPKNEFYNSTVKNSKNNECNKIYFTKIWDCGKIIFKYLNHEQ